MLQASRRMNAQEDAVTLIEELKNFVSNFLIPSNFDENNTNIIENYYAKFLNVYRSLFNKTIDDNDKIQNMLVDYIADINWRRITIIQNNITAEIREKALAELKKRNKTLGKKITTLPKEDLQSIARKCQENAIQNVKLDHENFLQAIVYPIYQRAKSYEDLCEINIAFLNRLLPVCLTHGELESETDILVEDFVELNKLGFYTLDSQPPIENKQTPYIMGFLTQNLTVDK